MLEGTQGYYGEAWRRLRFSSTWNLYKPLSACAFLQHLQPGSGHVLALTNELAPLTNTSVSSNIAGRLPLSHSNFYPLARAPHLGPLSRLPVELQKEFLEQMDLESLLVVRRINKRAVDLVGSLPEWKRISGHNGIAGVY